MMKKLLSILTLIFSVCLMTFTLTACEQPHEHAFTEQITEDAFIFTPATCEAKAQYFYSCACGEKGEETFESGDALGHSYGAYTSLGNGTHAQICANDNSHIINVDNCSGGSATCCDLAVCEVCLTGYGTTFDHWFGYQVVDPKFLATEATCEESATYYYSCECGAFTVEGTFSHGSNLGHNYANEWVSIGNNKHALICNNDSTHMISEECYGGTPTCCELAVCEVCLTSYGETLPHVYDIMNTDDQYKKSDATCKYRATYYYVCECGAVSTETFEYGDTLPHTLSLVETVQPTKEAEGYNLYYCSVCESNVKDDFVSAIGSQGLMYQSNGDGTCTVTGKGTCTDTKIIIPRISPDGDTVTAIGNSAFAEDDTIVEVVLPSSIKDLTYDCFYKCINLKTINLPESLTRIGDYVFQDCYSLAQITIPSGVTHIGKWAFDNCRVLESIVIPEGITSIKERTFAYCFKLNSVTIPKTVTSIGTNAFAHCYNIVSITIPSKVTSISNYAFSGCYKLSEIINLSTLNIQAGATNYGYIGEYALIVHNGESKIVNYEGFNFITVNGTNYLVRKLLQEKSIVTPETYNGEKYKIKASAFYQDATANSLTISSGVQEIGDSAFSGTNISIIVVPSTVNIFYGSAAETNKLVSVTICSGVRVEGTIYMSGTFVELVNHSSLFNHKNVTKPSHGLIHTGISKTERVGDYVFFSNTSSTRNYLMAYHGEDKDFVTPTYENYNKRTYEIYSNVFAGLDSLESVTITSAVTIVHSQAFQNCKNLKTLTVNKGVEHVYESTFKYCTSLTTATLDGSNAMYHNEVFYGCTSLSTVNIATGVQYLGYQIFSGCTKLTNLNMLGTAAQWDIVKKGSAWTWPQMSSLLTVTCTDKVVDVVIQWS